MVYIAMNVNSIVAQQIRDLQPRPIPFIQPAAPRVETGMQTHCYNIGRSHAAVTADPTPVLDGVEAAPCTWSAAGHQAYTQGFIDGLGL